MKCAVADRMLIKIEVDEWESENEEDRKSRA